MTSSNRATATASGERRRPSGHIALPDGVPGLPPTSVRLYRSRQDALAQRITDRICHEVAGFADPGLAGLVGRAIRAAVTLFVDTIAGAPTSGRAVSDYYWWLGRAEAQSGHDLDAMRAAHHVATQEVWAELDAVAVELGLSATVHHRLAHAVMEYQRSLQDRAAAGHADAQEIADPRTPLLEALLAGASLPQIEHLARRCWPLPQRVAVLSATVSDAAVARSTTWQGVLRGVRRQRIVVIADAASADDLADDLAEHSSSPVAVSWGVDPTDVPHAWRWATRALRLALHHEIDVPASRVIKCQDHRAELLRHADPVLSRQLMVDLLAPLLAESPSQREALGQTMLLWLQTRASAPVLAARLGVHDQTVRNRLRRLRAMFGETLDQPERALELMQALHVLRDHLRR